MNMKIMLGLMGFLSAIALCTVLHVASGVFIPLVVAWFILQILRPVIQLGRTFRPSPWLNVMLSHENRPHVTGPVFPLPKRA